MRLAPLLLAACAAGAHAQAGAPSRGQLLYATHCVECHNAQVHWRNQRQVRDWETLRAWVRHWQGDARLQWTEEDVEAVARYLNDSVYHFAQRQAAQ